ncbi:2-oxo-hepta-3-ene-1%2C7-dioic acid hydratase [Yersinia enterocolitica]|uniref:2-keto-4-pentenoate hydratase n=1 Tax=Yersinia enterocolitica TaxID=630 RepID=UPI0005E034A0|nr:fumarylacetoacetate hydrolase family protein [Yersinia enterocolitica]CNG75304.1 2-oxo-hepta-3-ene-1%2C7-dioic acid hydratase [Yersinia enterocolitica]
MTKDEITHAADLLEDAIKTGTPSVPLRQVWPTISIEDAYLIQAFNTQRHIKAGASRVGAKIGLTSEVVQMQMGVDQPDFGVLLNTMKYTESESIPSCVFIQPKVEGEIAFVLGRALTGRETDLSEIIDAIDFALAAVEIVDSRIKDWDISISDTIADNASAGAFVTGSTSVRLSCIDLLNCKMTMTINGAIVSEGKGRNCLGNPLVAVQWLARTMAELGCPLQAGEVVLAGALGPMAEVSPGDVVDVIIEGAGRVKVTFATTR